MREYLKSLPHHPKRVIIISLFLAIIIGFFGYLKINEKIIVPVIKQDKNVDATTMSSNITLGFLSSGRIKTVSVQAGDIVKKGQVLAMLDAGNMQGALVQAQAVYMNMQANYQKIINGATSAVIDVARAAVHTALVNLDGVQKQQNLLVQNAHTNLLNSTLAVNFSGSDNSLLPPVITGTYTKDTEGIINFTVNQTGSNGYVNFSGLVNGIVPVSTTNPQMIMDTGLFIEFPSSSNNYTNTNWTINIPNKNASNYLSNYNNYQSALQVKNQAIANAQAILDQANVSLNALVAAGAEDVVAALAQMNNAKGAVDIALANYQNTIITAPADGMIVSVIIAPGQIAIANSPAINFSGFSK